MLKKFLMKNAEKAKLLLNKISYSVLRFTGELKLELEVSESDGIKLFKKNPIFYFNVVESPSSAGPNVINLKIDVRVMNIYIGYIQNTDINKVNRTATVGHFAVATANLTGKGLGRILAHALRLLLLSRYDTREIIFSENSTKYFKSNYPEFFKSLGATSTAKNSKGRSDWIWKI